MSNVAYTLRPYVPADFAGVVELFESNTPRFFAPAERDDFLAFLDAPASELFVATAADGTLLGFGAAYCRSAHEGGLAWGMVHQRWHRRGVGTALLDARISRLWALAMTQIRVHTSQHSAGFFAQAGFETVAVRPDGFATGIDHVTMILHRPTVDDELAPLSGTDI